MTTLRFTQNINVEDLATALSSVGLIVDSAPDDDGAYRVTKRGEKTTPLMCCVSRCTERASVTMSSGSYCSHHAISAMRGEA